MSYPTALFWLALASIVAAAGFGLTGDGTAATAFGIIAAGALVGVGLAAGRG